MKKKTDNLARVYRSIGSKQILFWMVGVMLIVAFLIGGLTVAGIMIVLKIDALEEKVIRIDEKQNLLLPSEGFNETKKAFEKAEYWNHLSAVKPALAVYQYATRYNLDPKLVRKIIKIESSYDPRALSNKGAKGLMQVMDYWFDHPEDPYGIETNIERGCWVLAICLCDNEGNLLAALEQYHSGPAGGPKGKTYARKVVRAYRGM